MDFDLSRSFVRDLSGFRDEKLKQRVRDFFVDLGNCNDVLELSNVLAMVGQVGYYRKKIGDYRLGFFVDDGVVYLLRFAHRKDIYRKDW